ncbi:MAG: aspartate aminotransferase family protein [Bacteroidetes bacterium]|nr:aspartate aminotransferase family protein [Bacteroidota bacterium]
MATVKKNKQTSTKSLSNEYLGKYPGLTDIEVVSLKNSYLIDSEGKKYIDFLGGWCVGNIGWGNKEIEAAIKKSQSPTYVHPGFLYRPWAELAKLLAEITPGDLKVSFRTTGGSESIEAALQIAMLYTGRHKFMSVEGSYHGDTIGALSIGSSDKRELYKNLLPNCYKINTPLDKKSIKKIEERLKKKDVAAFIMEPVICNLGVYIPEQGFWEKLSSLCKKYGTLLIMDEVATGFGRTGKLFAVEHFGIVPDIMCFSKAISGGYAGIGAIITTEKIAKKIEGSFNIYSTYGWHPLSVDATIAYIKYWKSHTDEILKNVEEISDLFRGRFVQMDFAFGAELNIIGLAIGLDVLDKGYAKDIVENCRKEGLIIKAEGSNLAMFPALNIKEKVVRQGLDIFESCL